MIKHYDSQKGFAHEYLIIGLVVLLIGSLGFIFWQNSIKKSDTQEQSASTNAPKEIETGVKDTKPKEAYMGTYTTGGNFQAKIPNGWTVDAGSYSGTANSQLVLLAGPNQLDKLMYDEDLKPVINEVTAFGWDGLSEHFYIISQELTVKNYVDYEKASFTLEDGTKGDKYTRILTKDQQQGMSVFNKEADSYTFSVYEFTKNGVTVRAYLNYYSNTSFDFKLAENVIRSIKL